MKKRLLMLCMVTALLQAEFFSLEDGNTVIEEAPREIISQEVLEGGFHKKDLLEEKECECSVECCAVTTFLGYIKCVEYPALWALLGLF